MIRARLLLSAVIVAASLVAACGGGSAASTPEQTPAASVQITAHNLSYDKNTIVVPANTQVAVTLDNQDQGVTHNFGVYDTSAATTTIFAGELTTGPATQTYTFTSPAPGTYYFRCDVHPTTMHGDFVVR
jgi:plastocyanin